MLKPFFSKFRNSARGKFLFLLSPAVVAAAVAMAFPASAQSLSRLVIVNGKVMNSAELSILDTANCGTSVPNGMYWLNVNTGAWGYQGGPQQGVIGSQCRTASQTPQADAQAECRAKYRYWEDRMANCYGVSAYQNPVYR